MIAGLVLAAGESRRMGSPKLTLPWRDDRTVVGAVVAALVDGGVDRVLVVVGGDSESLGQALAGHSVEFVENPAFAEGEMLSSIQAGLRALGEDVQAALLIPGDMPAIEPATVEAVIVAWKTGDGGLCVPVFAGRRGHPVLLPRRYWADVLALGPGDSLRAFLRRHTDEIVRVEVQDPGIHADIDTPQDYREAR
jgi:molybdenum cofactor cytidylyltransferase